MSESDNQDKPKRQRLRAGYLPLESIINQKAKDQNIPESEVKLKIALPRPDGRIELTMQEIKESKDNFVEKVTKAITRNSTKTKLPPPPKKKQEK